MRLLVYFAATRRSVYRWEHSGPRLLKHFSPDDAGIARFRDYLKGLRKPLVQVVTDLDGEDFQEEQIPCLRGAERRTVIERRLAQRYRDARLAAAISLGETADERRNERLLLASFNDAQPLAGWLDALEQAGARAAGVYSTALLAPALALRLSEKTERLFLMSANHAGLRQTYVESGRLRFSRLERIGENGEGLTAARVRIETERMLKYLGTLRALPSNTQPMRVTLVVPDAERVHFERTLADGAGVAFTTLSVTEAARRIRLRYPQTERGAEMLYLHLAGQQPPREQFLRGENRHGFLLWRLQRSFVGVGGAAFVACSVYAATLCIEQLALRERIEAVRADAAVARDRLARVAARLPGTSADIESFKASALELRRIAARTGSPEAAFEHVSRALDQSPRIELDALAWSVEPEQALEINGRVSGVVRSDHRAIADEVQRFAKLLGATSGWRVVSTRLPFDLSSEGVLAVAAGTDAVEPPRFAVRIARSSG